MAVVGCHGRHCASRLLRLMPHHAAGCESQCGQELECAISQLDVERVFRLEHPRASERYLEEKGSLASALKKQLPLGVADVVNPPLSSTLPGCLKLHQAVNECYLWHGTNPDAVGAIACGAFIDR